MFKVSLPLRYLFKKRISYLAVLAVAVCVFIVVVVMTVMTGLVNNFKVKNHNFVGDCIVGTDSLVGFSYYEEFEKILEDCDIVHASSSAVKSHGILTPAGSDENYIIEVMGIEPTKHAKVTAFGDWLYYNRGRPENAFRPMYDPNKDGCVIGIDLMMNRDQLGQYHHSKRLAQIEVVISCFPLTAKLAGGVAQINVGAATEAEMKEKKARVEDALHACRAAIEEGILPGGGVSTLRVLSALDKIKIKGDEAVGVDIVRRAVVAPIKQIAQNAGLDGSIVAQKVIESDEINFGYNALTKEYGDMIEFGVIVPTKVERTALQNGASIASLLLTTDAIISDIPSDSPAAPAMPGGGGMY